MTAQEVATNVIGMSQEMARLFCLSKGCQYRIIRINKEYLIVTRDYVPTRVNVEVENDKVTDSSLG